MGRIVHSPIVQSLAGRLALLAVVFLAVPVLIFDHFRRADDATHALLLANAQRQGQLIARALEPELARAGLPSPDLRRLGEVLGRFADEHTRLRLLLRPTPPVGQDGFFYVASSPPVPAADLDGERERLLEQGVLNRLGTSCAGRTPLALRVERSGGDQEILTSITPMDTPAGCWALVTSTATAALVGSSLGRPYWETPAVQAAALVYAVMAALVLAVMAGLWRTLQQFRVTARAMADGDSGAGRFSQRTRVPELAGVAADFDRLVDTLRQSAQALRQAAEDNAHAFKTPIAVIRQAVEPLRRTIDPADTRPARALALIEASLDKLDGLVGHARRMDEAAADLLAPDNRRRLDLSALVERMAAATVPQLAARAQTIGTRITPGLTVRAGVEALETVIDNLVENALSFSPPGGTVTITLERRGAMAALTVEDEGPGVDPAVLPRIFERYVSHRAPGQGMPAAGEAGEPHFGIGLWIVRRNIEALGGTVEAGNRNDRTGFRITALFPLSPSISRGSV
ncbi:two-component system sensor histidine kinase ChvG [Azospirillum fermentarium]|uniref:sensor histidine kinase n=1 Tax=Azospirillum fermentarium TaxID=1233114 RepID=UPI002227C38D|nr:HAMP domain-containing sensor histidine kinase [Azospirillum fermentarium]MCW2246524.1 two-component system sensor histidine kinase ChvG [Azospirillum fermentarium]